MLKNLNRIVCLVMLAAVLGAEPVMGMGSFDTSESSKDARMVEAEKAIEAHDWNKAIGLLNRVVADSPKNADAYNYLGYSYRKLGNREQALSHYNHALSLDPNHRGALEYLGELYLDMRNIAKAEEQLGRLSRVCGPRCAEYRELREQVDNFKKGQPSG